MRLQEAYDLANLRLAGQQPVPRAKYRTAAQLAEEIFAEAEQRGDPFLYLNPESWRRKWLPSKKFHLVRLPLNACALPCEPKGRNLVLKKIHAREEKPIIVDYNINQVGKAMTGYVPQIIVIDGKHRFSAATIRGESHIMAWVGESAMEMLPAIHAVGGSGGGPAPDRMIPAKGASLVGSKKMKAGFSPEPGAAKNFSVPHKANLNSKGKKIKQLDVDSTEDAS